MTDREAANKLRQYQRAYEPIWSDGMKEAFERAIELLEVKNPCWCSACGATHELQ